MSGVLQGVRVAILVSDGFEEAEVLEPRRVLDRAGAATFVISPMEDKVTGSGHDKGEKTISVEIPLRAASAQDFHGLLLPGGGTSASYLKMDPEALEFVKKFMDSRKPVAAIGEGLEILLKTGTLTGRLVTGVEFLEGDIGKAGAIYVDRDVVRDGNFITARRVDDLSSFIREAVHVFAELREHSTDMRKIA